MYNNEDFSKAISESFKKYMIYGARSTEKLKPIHKYIAEVTKSIFGEEFVVHYMDNGNKELTVEGKYYPKAIDITVTYKDEPVVCIGIKFVTSNYKQNANNYFETMMGETANIQATKSLPYFQIIVFRQETPYYLKDGEKAKTENINDKDIKKYINLINDIPQAHRPMAIGIFIIDLNEKNRKVNIIDIDKHYIKDIADILKRKLSMNYLFDEIKNYKNYLKVNM